MESMYLAGFAPHTSLTAEAFNDVHTAADVPVVSYC